jgi:hypothetical protein
MTPPSSQPIVIVTVPARCPRCGADFFTPTTLPPATGRLDDKPCEPCRTGGTDASRSSAPATPVLEFRAPKRAGGR